MSSFLYFEEETQEVKIHGEAMSLLSVMDVYNSDKRPEGDKPYFNKVCKYIYHQYYNKHPLYENLSFIERKQKLIDNYFGGHNTAVNDLEKNVKVKEMVKDYQYYMYLFSERKYQTMLSKIDQLSEHLETIPLKRYTNVEHMVKVKVPGSDEEHEVMAKGKMEIDNSKEYFAAIEMIKKALDIEEEIRNRLKKEKMERDLSPKTMMDEGLFPDMKIVS